MSAPAILPIIGSVVSGAASAWSAKQAEKDEEKRQIAEERRREERYRGIGDAAAVDGETETFMDETTKMEVERRKDSAVGARAPQVGDKYRFTDRNENGVKGRRGLDQPAMQRPALGGGAQPLGGRGGLAMAAAQTGGRMQKPRYAYNAQSGKIEIAGG